MKEINEKYIQVRGKVATDNDYDFGKDLQFTADKVDIGRKKIDGTRQVVIDVGEYECEKLAPILTLEEGNYKITIEKV